LGDELYGFKANRFEFDVSRILLHASEIEFAHPVSGNAISINAPLPEAFQLSSSAD